MDELTAKELLLKLMQHFHVNADGNIEWLFKGVTIDDIDPKLADKLANYLRDADAGSYIPNS